MTDTLVVLPNSGDPLAMSLHDYRAAQARARELGLAPATNVAPSLPGSASQAEERLLDSRQLAELFGCNDTLLEAMAKDGRIPSYRIGRLLRFKPSEVQAALRHADNRTATPRKAIESTAHFTSRNRNATRPRSVT